MLTKLKVSGFKNLIDTEIYFGPFTCIAGANGVGKSNIFDAIHFLKLLTSKELTDAAQSIRDEGGKSGSIRGLFFRSGEQHVPSMRFEAEMITPKEAVDHLRQKAAATSTLLRYTLELGYRGEESPFGPLEILKEELDYIKKGESPDHLLFPLEPKHWRDQILVAERRTGKPYLRTEVDDNGQRVVHIQQEGTAGRPQKRLAEALPRTVLSSLSAAEAPTAVVARSEMASWRLLQLEPSALRRSDELRAPSDVAADGAHLPATLHRLVANGRSKEYDGDAVRQRIANRLAELVDDIRDVRVEKDEKRELLTVLAKLRDGTEHPARSLSDGTLRFLALAVIEHSTEGGGLFCLEEPENGIHPERVPSMLELLREIAVDPKEPDGIDNPLRQVIVNTHSPLVVREVPEDALVIAEPISIDGTDFGFQGRVSTVRFSALGETWRCVKGKVHACSKGTLTKYLNPSSRLDNDKMQRADGGSLTALISGNCSCGLKAVAMQVDFTLLADGASDRTLLPIAQWVFAQHVSAHVPVRGEIADLSVLRQRPKTLQERIASAIDLYPCNVLLVHRDAEAQDPDKRYEEIEAACQNATLGLLCHVCIVPVRMTEAWLLFDEHAIRKASGNPNGTMPLNLPSFVKVESVIDPKCQLLETLQKASGLKGRRRKAFRPERARWILANLIDNFSPLQQLDAFNRFERDVKNVLGRIGSAGGAM